MKVARKRTIVHKLKIEKIVFFSILSKTIMFRHVKIFQVHY